MTMIAEGAESARRDKEAAEFKRKRDEKQAWEGASPLIRFVPRNATDPIAQTLARIE